MECIRNISQGQDGLQDINRKFLKTMMAKSKGVNSVCAADGVLASNLPAHGSPHKINPTKTYPRGSKGGS